MMLAASTTTATAPWWYVAALAGGFTILGGLLTVASAYFSDRRTLKREDMRQWDPTILSACGRAHEIVYDILTTIGRNISTAGVAGAEYARLDGQIDKLNEIVNELIFIAPQKLTIGAAELRDAARDALNEWMGSSPGGPTPKRQQLLDALNHFTDRGRTTLRVAAQ